MWTEFLEDKHVKRMNWRMFKYILGRIARKNVLLTAAGLAYFFLMALIPALLLLSSLSNYLSLQNGVHDAMDFLSYVLPEQGESTIADVVKVIGARRVGLLSIGFLTTLWLASTALEGVILSIDSAHGSARPRSMWKSWSLALGLTMVIGSLFLLTVLLASFGPAVGGSSFGQVLKWSLATLFILAVLEMLYVLAPSAPISGRCTMPGAIVATAMWVVVSWALGLYFHHFAASHLGSLFGLLATPLAFMVWLYWSAAAILIGAEINSGLSDPP
jgi:membrane protein